MYAVSILARFDYKILDFLNDLEKYQDEGSATINEYRGIGDETSRDNLRQVGKVTESVKALRVAVEVGDGRRYCSFSQSWLYQVLSGEHNRLGGLFLFCSTFL